MTRTSRRAARATLVAIVAAAVMAGLMSPPPDRYAPALPVHAEVALAATADPLNDAVITVVETAANVAKAAVVVILLPVIVPATAFGVAYAFINAFGFGTLDRQYPWLRPAVLGSLRGVSWLLKPVHLPRPAATTTSAAAVRVSAAPTRAKVGIAHHRRAEPLPPASRRAVLAGSSAGTARDAATRDKGVASASTSAGKGKSARHP